MLPNSASESWSQFGRCSNGNRKVSNSTARIKEPANPPTDKDTAESVSTYSGDQLHGSKILETNGTSTSSSGVYHEARASGSSLASCSPVEESGSPIEASGSPVEASGSPVGATGPLAEGTRSPARVSDLESHCPSPKKPKQTLAPDVGKHKQSVEIEAQKRLIVPAKALNLSTKSLAGKERDPLVYDDTTSMHAGRGESTPTSYLEVQDNLQGPPSTGNPKSAGSISSASEKGANPGTGWHSGQKAAGLLRYLPTRYQPSQKLEDNKSSSSAKATLHLSQPQSVTPPTGPKNHRFRHLKSLSAEAPAFRPKPPPSMPTTPTGTYGNGHGKSASIEIGQSKPSSSSAMPTRPRGQHSARKSSFSIRAGKSQNPRRPYPSTGPHHPAPRQHTPQGQGQYFATPGSRPFLMPTQVPQPFDGNMSPLPSPMLPSPMLPSSMPPSDYGTPQNNAHGYGQDEHNVEYSQSNHFDSYGTPQAASAAPNASEPQQNGSMYTQDTNGYGPTYYSNHTDPTHQVDLRPLRMNYLGLI